MIQTISWRIVLAALTLLLFVTGARDGLAGDHSYPAEFKEAEFFIEYNSSAGDTGVQVFLDDDNWRRVSIFDPSHRVLFEVGGKRVLGRQGLTEFFFESVEPELADLPLMEFLERFPEGDYLFKGVRNDGVRLASEVEFTHIIPCAPEVGHEGAIADAETGILITWDAVTEVVDPEATDAAGETVCMDSGELEIASYQVIVEGEDADLIVHLPADALQLSVPPELLEPNQLYLIEVLAREESGNQTITESYFCTGPDLTEAGCEVLSKAH